MALNINVTILNFLINKLRDPKVVEEKTLYRFCKRAKENIENNWKFKGYWFVKDPETQEDHMVSIIDIYNILSKKKNEKIFFFDLEKLLSRGDGSGPARVQDKTFADGKFQLFEGADKVLATVKKLLED